MRENEGKSVWIAMKNEKPLKNYIVIGKIECRRNRTEKEKKEIFFLRADIKWKVVVIKQ